ncbi:MAG: TlyA family RNA methyltransferase [Anaerolineales bacterium]|nr:TlyA family RNA methyltransferase [Anaerolineales bacterium]
MKKFRVDVLLVERGLAVSRSMAQRLVMAGQVRANGQVVAKPSVSYPPDVALEVDQGPPFVSRGGEKLAGAVDIFRLDFSGLVCADIGASTGGFTDCMLQNGASKVYAIDVGSGILHWKLRQDERVVVMEGTNARHVAALPEPVQFVSVDASFISLKMLLPVFKHWFPEKGGTAVVLVKPQFEAGRKLAAKGKGVIRDPEVHRQVLNDILQFAQEEGFGLLGLERSPLTGPKGNLEFLAYLEYPAKMEIDLVEKIAEIVPIEEKPKDGH